ncbi:MAG: recombination protein RecR [Clostridia bacterium]|nr:recombination protein RecR [Clostridia bacterium]
MAKYILAPLEKLTEQFERLPGIGHKTASRLAYYVLTLPKGEAEKFAASITEAHDNIHYCPVCCNLTDKELCPICSDETRDRSVICVVESFRDVIGIEGTQEYFGLYHVLQGVLSPMKGIFPDMLRINELMARLKDGTVREVVMATNATLGGETTASYIAKLIKPLGIRVTRLATGLPAGGNIEYSDEVTLARALSSRLDM